ncbi:MAG: NAD(P)H-dependent oxidoreductase [Nanoarchaeota archaeon]|nr:NAD(P)H-dependent oxidoreductase [Nanoarchaeota archaeon]MBU4452416.1 NAD(P)H-dependent oxidoreductase [Nanoarchaeota archaeon]MCG2723890.1 NAD(P)H-dependent oxidoreductase [archaeon]
MESKTLRNWKCSVCGYNHNGPAPPEECPQCSGSGKEFREYGGEQRLKYDGKKFDVLVINGSAHRGHNTDIMASIAENALRKRNVSYRRFDLNELRIKHCWCCYSIRDSACTYPCRNQLDDMPALHEMILDAKAVIIASPINWNSMSARLKDFLDRLTSIQNMVLLKKEAPATGKVFGVLINGHEDGAVKTMLDIFLYFQQMGYIFAPFGFAYKTHGAEHNSETDADFFRSDEKLKASVQGVVNNVVEMMNQGAEAKLKGKIIPVSE